VSTHPSVARAALVVAVALASVTALVACGDDDDDSASDPPAAVEGAPATAQDLEANSWQLSAYAVAGADDLAGAQPSSPGTATFDGSTVSGSTGCNSYNGSYQVPAAGRISFGEIASTKAACTDDAATKQEQGMLAGFGKASRVVKDREDLQFLDNQNNPVLVFVVAKATELEGTKWDLLSYRTPSAVQSALAGAPITATFDSGTMSGSNGCNNYSAPYTGGEGTSGALKLGPIAQQLMACSEPEGIAEQEQAYGAALESVVKFEIAGDKLTLLDDQGRDAATYQG
jgi:heat shock protein HslJ